MVKGAQMQSPVLFLSVFIKCETREGEFVSIQLPCMPRSCCAGWVQAEKLCTVSLCKTASAFGVLLHVCCFVSI